MSGLLFSKNNIVFYKIFFDLNCVDPDKMQNYSAFHLGLHCLLKYLFNKGFPVYKGFKEKGISMFHHHMLNSLFFHLCKIDIKINCVVLCYD